MVLLEIDRTSDSDLADLYGIKTKWLSVAVRRNRVRFPPDFMFQLSAEEARNG